MKRLFLVLASLGLIACKKNIDFGESPATLLATYRSNFDNLIEICKLEGNVFQIDFKKSNGKAIDRRGKEIKINDDVEADKKILEEKVKINKISCIRDFKINKLVAVRFYILNDKFLFIEKYSALLYINFNSHEYITGGINPVSYTHLTLPTKA